MDVPPPQTADDLVGEPFSSGGQSADILQRLEMDEYLELIEDVAAARQAVEEYEASGIDGSIAYGEYRERRFEQSGRL